MNPCISQERKKPGACQASDRTDRDEG
jgi:hypothetical protein